MPLNDVTPSVVAPLSLPVSTVTVSCALALMAKQKAAVAAKSPRNNLPRFIMSMPPLKYGSIVSINFWPESGRTLVPHTHPVRDQARVLQVLSPRLLIVFCRRPSPAPWKYRLQMAQTHSHLLSQAALQAEWKRLPVRARTPAPGFQSSDESDQSLR